VSLCAKGFPAVDITSTYSLTTFSPTTEIILSFREVVISPSLTFTMLTQVDVDMVEFDVSPRHGFLPDELPLHRLSDPYYSSWEDIIEQLPSLLHRKALRYHIDNLPVLSTSHLQTLREWQRAYQVLSFLTHGYIWDSAEGGGPSEVLCSP
jgi:hypothetical protein